MSVSSHLTPQPESRLWILFDNTRHAVERSEAKIAGLAAFAALELGFVASSGPGAFLSLVTVLPLFAAIVLGLAASLPLARLPRWLQDLEPPVDKPAAADCMVLAEDIAKYTQAEMILRLDRYLGGGITATQYYEDIVGQIVLQARAAARKERLFRWTCLLVLAGQPGLLLRVLRG